MIVRLNQPRYIELSAVVPEPEVTGGELLLGALGLLAGVVFLDKLFNGSCGADTFKYRAMVGRREVHGGITCDLARREREHGRTWSNVRLVKVGRRTTRAAALAWERRNGY